MTQDDIIDIAKEAGWPDSLIAPIIMAKLHDFAKLVAAKEREACADMVFRYISQTDNMEARGCLSSVAYDIRARGEA